MRALAFGGDVMMASSTEPDTRAAPGAAAPEWSLGGVVEWLFTEGRHIGDPKALVDALCGRLLEAGAPVWRVRIGFRTLHPQVLGWTFTWVRGRGTVPRARMHGLEQSEDYVGSPIEHVFETHTLTRHRLDRLDPERDHPILHQVRRMGGVDYVAMPLVFSTGQVSAFIPATDRAEGFSDADIARFEALADFLAPVFEVLAARRIAESLLDTYVGHRAGRKVLQGSIKRGDGELIHSVIWFSDLRDSTRLGETLPPQRMLAMLNAYFELVAAAVDPRGGEILRFIGDAALIVFPCESRDALRVAAEAAVDAAADAFDNLATLNHRRRRAGEPLIRFGVGLHVGQVTYGNVGSLERLDFTVVGPAVNRAARIEGLTKALGVPLLLSAELAAAIRRPVRALGAQHLDGVDQPQAVFTLAADGTPFQNQI
jgi:adenylate cyclase